MIIKIINWLVALVACLSCVVIVGAFFLFF